MILYLSNKSDKQLPIELRRWSETIPIAGNAQFTAFKKMISMLSNENRPWILYDESVQQEYIEQLDNLRYQTLGKPENVLPFFMTPVDIFNPERVTPSSPFNDKDTQLLKQKLSQVNGPILLEGETGTGKSSAARFLHEKLLGRKESQFRALNCATLDPHSRTTVNAMFRGIQPKAFTDVVEQDPIFKELDKGTLLLDEFQELFMDQQAMLLDLISPFSTQVCGHMLGEIVGKKTSSQWKYDVMVIVATNKPVEKLLKEEKLRPDIYYRIPYKLRLLPLREKLSEKEGAAFLRNKLLRMQECGLSIARRDCTEGAQDLMKKLRFEEFDNKFISIANSNSMPIPKCLLEYHWPGNYRELEVLANFLLNEAGSKVGTWNESQIEYGFSLLTQHSQLIDSANNTLQLEKSKCSRTLIAEAWLSELQRNTSINDKAKNLGVDPRTLKSRLMQIIDYEDSFPRALSFVEALSSDKKLLLKDLAKKHCD